MRLWLLPALAALPVVGAGCPNNGPPSCIDVSTTCQELYPPTFDKVYTNTLMNTCGSQRVSCHSRDGHQGGMSFEDPMTAYNALISGRVSPGDPSCSLMIGRTASAGADFQMPPPPATPLSAAEECALIKWVANGAPGLTALEAP